MNKSFKLRLKIKKVRIYLKPLKRAHFQSVYHPQWKIFQITCNKGKRNKVEQS